jgi:hypothetical protein
LPDAGVARHTETEASIFHLLFFEMAAGHHMIIAVAAKCFAGLGMHQATKTVPNCKTESDTWRRAKHGWRWARLGSAASDLLPQWSARSQQTHAVKTVKFWRMRIATSPHPGEVYITVVVLFISTEEA